MRSAKQKNKYAFTVSQELIEIYDSNMFTLI